MANDSELEAGADRLRQPVAVGLIVGGLGLVCLGSLLPWASVSGPLIGTVTKYGIEGDGAITLIGALVIGALTGWTLLRPAGSGHMLAALVTAALIGLIAVVDMADLRSRFSGFEHASVDASIGVGLWLVLLGSLVAVSGCAWWLARARAGSG